MPLHGWQARFVHDRLFVLWLLVIALSSILITAAILASLWFPLPPRPESAPALRPRLVQRG